MHLVLLCLLISFQSNPSSPPLSLLPSHPPSLSPSLPPTLPPLLPLLPSLSPSLPPSLPPPLPPPSLQGEIKSILDMGVSPDRIIYANPCKQLSHLKYACKRGVATMTFDNEVELHKVNVIILNEVIPLTCS